MVSHAGRTQDYAERAGRAAEQYSRTVAPMKLRSLDEVTALLTGFEVVDPGVVYCSQWRPDPDDAPDRGEPLPQLCALARKA
jgi:hypothetical protein